MTNTRDLYRRERSGPAAPKGRPSSPPRRSVSWAASTRTPASCWNPGTRCRGGRSKARCWCFPTGKGSTVGSYTILRLAKSGAGPVAMVNAESEAIVAVGAIIADIPMVDRVDIDEIQRRRLGGRRRRRPSPSHRRRAPVYKHERHTVPQAWRLAADRQNPAAGPADRRAGAAWRSEIAEAAVGAARPAPAARARQRIVRPRHRPAIRHAGRRAHARAVARVTPRSARSRRS